MTHEFQGEAYEGSGDTIAEAITDAEYDGWPLAIMTTGRLLQQGHEGNIVNYVWPHEGQFKNGKWCFHKGKIIDQTTEIDAPTAPLMIDASSARAFLKVWEAINEKNKAKTTELLQSRGLTVWVFDKLIWPNVSFGGS